MTKPQEDYNFFQNEHIEITPKEKFKYLNHVVKLTLVVVLGFCSVYYLHKYNIEQDNLHEYNLRTLSISRFDRNTHINLIDFYIHHKEKAIISNFFEKDFKFIQKYSHDKDFELFSKKIKNKSLLEILTWISSKEYESFFKSVQKNAVLIEKFYKNHEFKQKLLDVSINKNKITLIVESTNNSDLNIKAVKGKLYLNNVFEENIISSEFTILDTIKSKESMRHEFIITSPKSLDVDYIKNSVLVNNIFKISTYNDNGEKLFNFSYQPD